MKHKMWSRLLSMVLAVMMITSIVPNSAFAEAASEIAASSQATSEVQVEEVPLPEDTTTEEPAAETPAEEPAAETPAEEPAGEPAPTAEPVAEPTAEPVTESEQPAAEPTQAPAETAMPSEQPSAEPTAAPEGTETPEGTAVPSETPAASATPAPSESPVPSETPVPTETPVPSETPAATEEPEQGMSALTGEELVAALMQLDDEALVAALDTLTEEQIASVDALEAAKTEALFARLEALFGAPETDVQEPLDFNAMSVEELYEYLNGLTDDNEFFEVLKSLNDGRRSELENYISELNDGEIVTVGGETSAVNFWNAATPFFSSKPSTATFRSRSYQISNGFDQENTAVASGLKIDKKYDEKTKELELSAYVTGKVSNPEQYVPLDIVLVLDQSSSMTKDFSNGVDYEFKGRVWNSRVEENQTEYYYLDKETEEYRPIRVEVTDKVTGTTYSEVSKWRIDYSDLTSGGYYIKDGDSYYELKCVSNGGWYKKYTISYFKDGEEKPLVNGERNQSLSESTAFKNRAVYTQKTTVEYTYHYTDRETQKDLGTSVGANNYSPIELYQQVSTGETSRIAALSTAVTGFVEDVQADARDKGLNHRIALIGFAGAGSNYSNTEYLMTTDGYDDSGWWPNNGTVGYSNRNAYRNKALLSVTADSSKIEKGIKNISAKTTETAPQYGMQMAYETLQAYQNEADASNRKKIVILFTDGYPAASGTDNFDYGWADKTIEYAKSIKDMGASVYTVGIFDNANPMADIDTDFEYGSHGDKKGGDVNSPEQIAAANRYMQYVSSNYPSATDLKNGGSKADVGDKSFYLSARNAEALDQVFEAIAHEIQTPDIVLDSSTVMQDVLSEYFTLPQSMLNELDEAQTPEKRQEIVDDRITVSSQTINEKGEWSPKQELENVTVTLLPDNKTIRVTGFDYSANPVIEGKAGGQKLVLNIPIEYDAESSFGGNKIPTNAGTSGIYSSAGDICHGNFQSPTVDVPLNYEIKAKDQTIYISQSASLDQLLDYADKDTIQAFYKPDGIKNAFVNITYTLKQGETEVGTLRIDAGESIESATWTWSSEFSGGQAELKDCTEYTLECVVTAADNENEKIEFKEEKAKAAKVHVKIPKISVKDTVIEAGDSADPNDNIVSYPGKTSGTTGDWLDAQGHTGVADPVGDAPVITVTPKWVRGGDAWTPDTTNYAPTEDAYFAIEVKAGTTPLFSGEYRLIPNKIVHDQGNAEGCQPVDPTSGLDDRVGVAFVIHVKVTDGVLTFTKTLTALNKGESEARFTIKIEALDDSEQATGKVYYKTLVLNSSSKRDSFTMTLPQGKYKITELQTGGYTNGSITGSGFNNGVLTLGKTASLSVENNPNNPTYPHDKNTAVNCFSYNNDGNWTWNRQ